MSKTAAIAALLSALTLIVTGPGYKVGALQFGDAFNLMKAATGIGAIALVLGLIAVFLGRRSSPPHWAKGALLAVVIGGAIVVHMMSSARQGKLDLNSDA